MERGHHYITRGLCAFMAVITAICALPAEGLAARKAEPLEAEGAVQTALEPGMKGEAKVSHELEAQRGRDTKQFYMSDGSYTAVQYAQPVHYRKNGTWAEIDNTLTRAAEGYVNTASDVRFTFSDDTASLPVVRAQYEGCGITFISLEPAADAVQKSRKARRAAPLEAVRVENPAARADAAEQEEIAAAAKVETLNAGITYEGAPGRESYAYTLEGRTLKESILIPQVQEEYLYTFRLELEGLTPRLEEDGSVSLSRGEEQIFTIPAPYMFDAAGAQSGQVTAGLTAEAGGTYLYSLEAESAWINDPARVFPVAVDPSLFCSKSDGADQNIFTEFISDGDMVNTHRGSTFMDVGYSVQNGNAYSYLKVNQLPALPAGARFCKARVYIGLNSYNAGSGLGSFNIYTKKALASWRDEFSGYAANSAPVLDFKTISAQDALSYLSFDITGAASEWYQNSASNTGVVFYARQQNGAAMSSTAYASAILQGYQNSAAEQMTCPFFEVNFRSVLGIEDYYTYQTDSVGRAGDFYIGDYSGQATVIRTDVTEPDYTLSHVYSSAYADQHFTAGNLYNTVDYSRMKTGLGWKLSAQESVVTQIFRSYDGVTSEYAVYTDGDGTAHYFHTVGTETFADEDGLGLYLQRSGSQFTMSDQKNNRKIFINGYLSQIIDSNGNQTVFLYNTTEYDPAGSAWKPLASGNQLRQILQVNQGKTPYIVASLGYTGDYLTTVTDRYGRVTGFAHSANGLINEITDPDGVSVRYWYGGVNLKMDTAYDGESKQGLYMTYAPENGAVNCLYDYTAAAAEGSPWEFRCITGIYNLTPGKAEVRDSGDDFDPRTADDIVYTYLFDDYGRTVTVQSNDYLGNTLGASGARYKANSTTEKTNNRVLREGSVGKVAQNLLKTVGVETLYDDWTGLGAHQEGVYLASRTAEKKRSGASAIALILKDKSKDVTAYKSATITQAGDYTFSAYVNSEDLDTTGSETIGALLQIDQYVGSEFRGIAAKNNILKAATNQQVEGGWYRLTCTAELQPGDYNFRLVLAHAAGTVYFDDFQLEKGDTAGAYNYVSNGHFGFDTYAITSSANAAIVSGEEHDQQQGKMVKLTGGAAKESVYSQRIPMNCAAGSSFLLSGWAKADSLPAAEGRTFQLSAALHFESGAVQYVEAPFNPDVAGEWQYLSVPVAPERSETIQAVTVSCSYKRNENAAYFDDLSLVMEPCTAYLYNSDGNITAVNTTNRAELTCSYEGADLISQAGGANGNYTYTYDPQTKNITQATNENLQLSLSYDSAGRTTQSRLGNSWGPEYLKTSAGYIEDGSLVAQSEDTLGNQTTYSYTNESYGSPKSETRAASSGTVTQEYGYEANGRLSQTFISGVSSVHYGYSNGQLTSVENGGYIPGVAEKQTQSYSFAYDQYGNRTESRIGERLLARYENDKNTVKSMQYGNSESVSYQYSYDAYNRLKTSNNGEETETYYYNGAGDLSRLEVKHNSSKKLLFVYTYEYDSLGRLIRSREENGGSVRLQEVEYRYNNKNQLTQYTYYDGEQAKSEYVNYNSNGTIASFQPVNGDWQVYYYDGLNRLIRETVDHDANANLQYEISYSYKGQGEENRTTGLVSEKNYHYQNAGQSGVEDYKLSYTYDRVGNIKSSSYQTKRSGDSAAVTRNLGSYSYDQLNQLTVETVYNKSNSLGDIIEYEYDTYGNLRSAKHYAYEKKAGSFLPVKVLKKTESYSYGDSEWKDLLTGYNGQAITYDAIGNPLTYYNGQSYSMSWAHGRQLEGVSTGGKEIGFSYDKDGLRLGKSVGSTGYAYLWAGGRLAEQKWGDNRIIFSYDESGAPQSFYYRNASNSGENYGWGTKYYYVLNAQGDVVQLRDQNNAVVANYQYDAWGKLLYVYDNAGTEITDADHIALINPLRYRGYYYDSETGFYYLQSRYYDPVIRRFINADGFVSTGQGLLGYNMFTYCGNNPVNRNDLTGAFWKEVGDFFKKAGKAVVNFVKSTFGAGATVVRQTRQEIELSPPGVNLFVTVKKGTKENKTLSSRGNSSKPISVYAQGRSDNPLLSSAGLKINIASFTLNVSLGLDNIGISGSVKNGKATNTFGLSADLSQLKIGFESSTTVKWDNDTNVTDYINASVTAWGIAALYILVTTGEWVPSPQPAF